MDNVFGHGTPRQLLKIHSRDRIANKIGIIPVPKKILDTLELTCLLKISMKLSMSSNQ